MSDSPRSTRSPGRRRGAHLTAAIHDAVLAELTENGYDGVTFDRIARRAHMSKATLYSRYEYPSHLVTEALRSRGESIEFTPGDSLREDLRTLLTLALRTLDDIGAAVFRHLIADGTTESRTFIRETISESSAGPRFLAAVVDSARDRGELGNHPLPESVINAPLEILHSRVLLSDARDGLAEEITDQIALPLYTTVSRAS